MGRRRKLVRSVQDTERAATMAVLYTSGQSLQAIGDRFGVSRERVRQILQVVGVPASAGGIQLRTRQQREKARLARDARYQTLHGMTHAEYRNLPTATKKIYQKQRQNAKDRGIPWEFNIASWWCFWQESGKWDDRGRGYGYCMARHGDDGPYSPENVYICTSAQNASDQYIWKPFNSRERKRKSTSVLYVHAGRARTIAQWAREAGINPTTLDRRLAIGWSIARALHEPIRMTNTRRSALARRASA